MNATTLKFGAFVNRMRHDTLARQQFATYVAIGGLTQVVDIGLFLMLTRLHALVELAASLSIAAATVVHFSLNKYLNFRNHQRPLTHQIGTYLALGTLSLAFQVSLISLLTRLLFVDPLLAKIIALVINFPLGFLGHRYLTFGAGIRGAYVLWRAKRGGGDVPAEVTQTLPS
jgi:putative flippase GtrA